MNVYFSLMRRGEVILVASEGVGFYGRVGEERVKDEVQKVAYDCENSNITL